MSAARKAQVVEILPNRHTGSIACESCAAPIFPESAVFVPILKRRVCRRCADLGAAIVTGSLGILGKWFGRKG